MTTSRAAVLNEFGGLEAVELIERPLPEPADGEVLVRMHAVAVQPVEALVAAGALPMAKAPPLILGANGAGEVVVDSGSFSAGDRVAVGGFVLGLGADGVYAQHAVVPEDSLHLLRPDTDYESAATIGTAFPTAALALEAGRLAAGETVLVLGATGGVGGAAVQLARALGAEVIAVSRTAEGCRFAEELGAQSSVQVGDADLKAAVAEVAENVDVVLDPVGGELTGRAASTLGPGGRHVVLGYVAGVTTQLTITDLIMTGASMIGFSLWGPPVERVHEVEAECLERLNVGDLAVPIGGRFGLEDVVAAHAALASPAINGRILLTP